MSAYRTVPCQLARSAIALTLQRIQPVRFLTTPHQHNPLKVSIETDDLGLPVYPLPLPIPKSQHTKLSRETYEKLHKLSALNLPEEGSEEEAKLLDELGELIGLMEIVKKVELPSGDLRVITAELLGQGVGEMVFDGNVAEAAKSSADKMEERADEGKEEKKGKDLLEWATRRVGDYYASKK